MDDTAVPADDDKETEVVNTTHTVFDTKKVKTATRFGF
jgi:hypothetical protein